jgi:hypothetical protein
MVKRWGLQNWQELAPLFDVTGTLEYNWQGCTATSVWKWSLLKKVN